MKKKKEYDHGFQIVCIFIYVEISKFWLNPVPDVSKGGLWIYQYKKYIFYSLSQHKIISSGHTVDAIELHLHAVRLAESKDREGEKESTKLQRFVSMCKCNEM